jgi:hypothetical protein
MNTREFLKRFHDAAMALAINSTISYDDLIEMAHMLYDDSIFTHAARVDLGFEARMLRMRHGLVRFSDGMSIDNFDQACS